MRNWNTFLSDGVGPGPRQAKRKIGKIGIILVLHEDVRRIQVQSGVEDCDTGVLQLAEISLAKGP